MAGVNRQQHRFNNISKSYRSIVSIRAETFPKIWIRIRATLGYVVTEPRHAMCHFAYMGVHRVGNNGESALPLLKFETFDVKCCFHKKCPKIVALEPLVLKLHIFLKLV